jgi:hypothetical protein
MKYNCKLCNIDYESSRFSKYCKDCRSIKKKEYRKKYKSKVAAKKRENRKLITLSCKICDGEFKSFTKSKKYCSDKCKKKYASDYKKKYSEKNKKIIKEKNAKYYIENKEKIKIRNKKWASNNKDLIKQKRKRYEKRHPDRCRARIAETRFIKKACKKAFKEDYKILKKFYKKAADLEKQLGYRFNVDHIIPINHPDVCGLHVSWNLQVLSEEHNLIKNNSFDGTYSNNSWRNKIQVPQKKHELKESYNV